MRTVLTAAAASALLLVSACGGDDPTTPSSPAASASSSAAAPSTPLDEAALRGALLTASDVPSGYAVTEPTDDDDTPTDPGASSCEKFLDELDSFGDTAAAKAEVEFERSDDAGAGHLLASYADEAAATAELAKVTALVADCGSFTSEADGLKTTGKIVKLPLTGLSPDGLALNATFTFSAPGVPASSFGVDLSVARLGTTLSVVLFGDGGAVAVDHKVTERLGAKGYANLKAATR